MAHYTPEWLATLLAELLPKECIAEGAHVLDPCCGRGALLAGLAGFPGLNLYGVDKDAAALEAARETVGLLASKTRGTSAVFKLGNSLHGHAFVHKYNGQAPDSDKLLGDFHWDQEFPEIVGSGRLFDLIICNPPWDDVTFHDTDPVMHFLESKYSDLKLLWRPGNGKPSWWKAFVERSEQLTRPGGYVCMLLPQSILSDEYCDNTRKFLLSSNSFLPVSILHFLERTVWKDLGIGCAVLICQKVAGYSAHHLLKDYSFSFCSKLCGPLTLTNLKSVQIELTQEDLHFPIPKKLIVPCANGKDVKVLRRIREQSLGRVQRMEDFLIFHRGELSGTEARRKNWIASPSEPSSTRIPYIRGDQLFLYEVRSSSLRAVSSSLTITALLNKPQLQKFMNHRRLVIRRIHCAASHKRRIAASIVEGAVCADSVNYGISTEKLEKELGAQGLDVMLVILNSSVFEFLFRTVSYSNNITCNCLSSLPVPRAEILRDAGPDILALGIQLRSGWKDLELRRTCLRLLDRMVGSLYGLDESTMRELLELDGVARTLVY